MYCEKNARFKNKKYFFLTLKKIEAIINRKNYPSLREKLDALGIDIIDKRNLEDSKFVSESKGSRVGGTSVRSTMLAKIELAMPNKLAREVVDIISNNSGLPKSIKSKIFVFDKLGLESWLILIEHRSRFCFACSLVFGETMIPEGEY